MSAETTSMSLLSVRQRSCSVSVYQNAIIEDLSSVDVDVDQGIEWLANGEVRVYLCGGPNSAIRKAAPRTELAELFLVGGEKGSHY